MWRGLVQQTMQCEQILEDEYQRIQFDTHVLYSHSLSRFTLQDVRNTNEH